MSNSDSDPFAVVLVKRLYNRYREDIFFFDLSPLQITGIYTVFGFFALYVSDVYLPQTIQNPVVLAQIQALKGGMEIFLTAGLIFLLTTQSRKALAWRNDQLQALQAERSIVYRVVRHNLRNDINIVLGLTDLIQKNTTDCAIRDRCSRISDHAGRIGQYQSDIEGIERMLNPPIERQAIDLGTIVHESSRLRDLMADSVVAVSLDVDEGMIVATTPELWAAVDEVLDNAVRHCPSDDPSIGVTVEETTPGMVDLRISDNGPGIPAYEQDPIEQMEELSLSHSSGLGLWQAKLACSIAGGDLVFPNQDDGGQVVFRLPALTHRTLWYRLKKALT